MNIKLEEKIEGCLLGIIIEAELGFARNIKPENFSINKIEDIFKS